MRAVNVVRYGSHQARRRTIYFKIDMMELERVSEKDSGHTGIFSNLQNIVSVISNTIQVRLGTFTCVFRGMRHFFLVGGYQ